jgi:hypothetical protein
MNTRKITFTSSIPIYAVVLNEDIETTTDVKGKQGLVPSLINKH